MIQGLAIAFLVAFVGGHLADQQGDAFTRPLSCFRDVEPHWIGYAMFALLVAIALEMAHTARRTHRQRQSAVYLVAASLLTLTALTPSYAPIHIFAANASLLTLFANYAWLLDQRDSPYWLTAHLSIPLALVAADVISPSGSWEKALDLYFMVAVLIHHHAMTRHCSLENLPSETENASRPAAGQAAG